MKQYGSQIREPIGESGCILEKLKGNDAFIRNEDGELELWTKKDDFAGFVLEIQGIGYEFIRTVKG